MHQDAVAHGETVEQETPDAKARRLAREWEMIEEARRDLEAGHGLSGPALEAWLDRFARGDEGLDAEDETSS